MKLGDIAPHQDTGFICLVYHGDDESKGKGCIKCTCGEWVRPHDFEEHQKLDPDIRSAFPLSGRAVTPESVEKAMERPPPAALDGRQDVVGRLLPHSL